MTAPRRLARLASLVTLASLVLMASLLAWAVVHGVRERAKERRREHAGADAARVEQTPAGETIVTLDRGSQVHAGLRTEPLARAGVGEERIAYGQILDPTALVTLDGELSVAEAALRTSRAEYERTRALYADGENASRRAVETALAQYRADASRADALTRQMALAWGRAVPVSPASAREVLIRGLVSGSIVIARVTLPAGDAVANRPRLMRVAAVGFENGPVATGVVYDAPAVDPSVQGQAFLVRLDVRGPELRPGIAVVATVPGTASSVTGVVIPQAAGVLSGGEMWAYVQTGATRFIRRRVHSDHPTAAGWIVREGFQPGERVVVVGAQVLLSVETKPAILAGEEKD